MDERELLKTHEDDFIIRIRPYKDRQGSWNGEIDIALITQPENSFDDELFTMGSSFKPAVSVTSVKCRASRIIS